MPLLCGTNKKLHDANEMKKKAETSTNEEGYVTWDDRRNRPYIILRWVYIDGNSDCRWFNFYGYRSLDGAGSAEFIIGD